MSTDLPGRGDQVDRVVLAHLAHSTIDLAAARAALELWLSDHPAVDDIVDARLVHAEEDVAASLRAALGAVESLLPDDSHDGRHERVALVLAVPRDDAPAYEALMRQDATIDPVLVLPCDVPREVADVVAVLNATCDRVLDLTSEGQLRALSPRFLRSITVDPGETPAPDALDGPGPIDPAPRPLHLLYIAWLGRSPSRRHRATQRRWVSAALDLVTLQSPDHVVRLIGLGDGISDQSTMRAWPELRSQRLRGRRGTPWPRARGSINMMKVCHDLEALLARDLAQLEFESVEVTERSCLVVVGETPAGGGALRHALDPIASAMRFVWVTTPRHVFPLPDVLLSVGGAVHLVEHPDIALEVGRTLGRRQSDSIDIENVVGSRS